MSFAPTQLARSQFAGPLVQYAGCGVIGMPAPSTAGVYLNCYATVLRSLDNDALAVNPHGAAFRSLDNDALAVNPHGAASRSLDADPLAVNPGGATQTG